MKRIAIVAALRREVKPLLENGNWKTTKRQRGQQEIAILETDRAMLVCGGMGGGPAAEAAEALHEFSGGAISLVISAGLAGALVESLKVGDIFCPEWVYTTQPHADGAPRRLRSSAGRGGLVSVPGVAGEAEKKELDQSGGAAAVDMEAFSVAQVAQAHGYPFVAVKAISDEAGFAMPGMGRFIDGQGKFRTARFVTHVALRPGMWRAIARLNKNSARAARNLCQALHDLIADDAAHHLELISAWTMPGGNAPQTKPAPQERPAR